MLHRSVRIWKFYKEMAVQWLGSGPQGAGDPWGNAPLCSLSQNLSFLGSSCRTCRLCTGASPKLQQIAKDEFCCFSFVWNINSEQLSLVSSLVPLGYPWLCTWGSLELMRNQTWAVRSQQGSRCRFRSVPKGAGSPRLCSGAAQDGNISCCLLEPGLCLAEGTGIVKHLEAAEKWRFVLLDRGTFCE